jgi:hypothetical protein
VAGLSLLLIGGSLCSGSGNAAVLRTAATFGPATIYQGLGDCRTSTQTTIANRSTPLSPNSAPRLKRPTPCCSARPSTRAGCLVRSRTCSTGRSAAVEIYQKPVASINASSVAAPTGGADAHDSLRKVLTHAGAVIVGEACVHIPIPRDAVSDGLVQDLDLRNQIADVVAKLVRGNPQVRYRSL